MPSQSGTSGELGLAGDTYDECVYREDTMVLLELTTRDIMEVSPQAPCSRFSHSITTNPSGEPSHTELGIACVWVAVAL